jgi:hypothetical protein
MNVTALRKHRADPQCEIVALLRELLAEMRGLRADLGKRTRNFAVPALVAALGDYFGPGRFTAAGILEQVGEDPHGALASAVGELLDMNASPRSRSTALGALLVRIPEIEAVAQHRGCAVYRVRTSGE